MPAVNDVIQIALLLNGVEGGAITNVFTALLTSVAVDSWSAVADDVEGYLTDVYADWFENVANTVASESFTISKRDETLNRWDEKITRDFTDIVGDAPDDSLPSINSATVVGFPAVARHWGFKNFPPPAESATLGGSLTLVALADLILTGLVYVSAYTGADTNWNNGVYSLANEQFRGFQQSILVTDVIGSRVTRKEGRGI